MLSIQDTGYDRNCQGFARREFLKIGSLGMAGTGLSLSHLLAAQSSLGSYVRDKSVVFLFLQGGPSHIECFDPKMTAPVEFRSITGEVQTKIPGITFGSSFEKLSQMTDDFSIVRSYGSKNSGHTYQSVASGRNPLKATMGALYSRIVGTNHPDSGMPTNTLILPEAVSPGLKLGSNFETNALPTLTSPGDLGPNFAAFNPIGGGTLKQNMELKIPQSRFADRRVLLSQLDRLRRSADRDGLLEGTSQYQQQAFEVIVNGVANAFDLSQESSETIARYDTSHLFSNEEVHRWGDMRRASNLLGRQMLMARRLCEAGCGFVTVSDCGWDMHSNNNSPKNLGAMDWLGPQVDHAVAAFLEDVKSRGLSDKILLIVTGEMGRTPRINKNGGRDHYGELTPLFFAGGGLKMGQVVGQSDAQITRPATRPYAPEHLLATIMETLFDLGELRLQSHIPRELLKVAEENTPISELV